MTAVILAPLTWLKSTFGVKVHTHFLLNILNFCNNFNKDTSTIKSPLFLWVKRYTFRSNLPKKQNLNWYACQGIVQWKNTKTSYEASFYSCYLSFYTCHQCGKFYLKICIYLFCLLLFNKIRCHLSVVIGEVFIICHLSEYLSVLLNLL